MARKKKHAEHVNHERWLISYADFITLLFAFFVVLFSSGQADKKKQQKFASAFQNAFSQMALFSPSSKKLAPEDSAGANPNAEPKPIELPLDSDGTGDGERKRVKEALEKQIAAGALNAKDISLHPTAEGLTLSLHEGGFFDSGSAELRADAVPALTAIAGSLSDVDLRVEGHTDNVPMHSAVYATNWELSSARASTIARFLLEHGTVNPVKLSVAGYAEFHPVASNLTADGRAQNRRVDIVFLKAAEVQAEPIATQSKP